MNRHLMHRLSILPLVLIALGLSGCATPQAALDQANNTTALTVELAREVEAMRATQARIARDRLERIDRLNASLIIYGADNRWRNDVQEAAGNAERLRLMEKMRKLADSRGSYISGIQKDLDVQRAATAELVRPLPSQSAALTELQNALGTLGDELSHRERIEITSRFAKEIRESLDQNRKKIEEAKQSSPSASGSTP